jgi:hypothetical protein
MGANIKSSHPLAAAEVTWLTRSPIRATRGFLLHAVLHSACGKYRANHRGTEDMEKMHGEVKFSEFRFSFCISNFAFRPHCSWPFLFSPCSRFDPAHRRPRLPSGLTLRVEDRGESSFVSDAALFKMKPQICCAESRIVAFKAAPHLASHFRSTQHWTHHQIALSSTADIVPLFRLLSPCRGIPLSVPTPTCDVRYMLAKAVPSR